jgi:drug/metabolite transporter (DMT)-like permease
MSATRLSMAHPMSWVGAACVLASAILFAIKAILIKWAYAQDASLTGPTLLAIRMASALPFFMLMALYTQTQPQSPTRQDWFLLLVAGLLGYYLASVLDFIGLQYVSASLERIILFLYPTLTVLMTAALQRQRISRRTILAIVLSYGGTIMVMLGEGTAALHANGALYGSALVFAGAVAYAMYLVMTPTLIRRFGSWRFTGLAMSTACLASIAHALMIMPHPIQTLAGFAWPVWVLGVTLGVFSTVLPATLLMQGIERVGAAQAAMLSSGGPILTVLLAVVFLGDTLNSAQWLGCAFNMIGVLMITLTAKPAATSPPTA